MFFKKEELMRQDASKNINAKVVIYRISRARMVFDKWFNSSRAIGERILTRNIRIKALQIASELNIKSFAASKDWLVGLRERNKLAYKKAKKNKNIYVVKNLKLQIMYIDRT